MAGRMFLRPVTGGPPREAGLVPIDPATLPGLELYLRSDQVIGADASPVSAWPDISGNNREANLTLYTSATAPTLRLSGANIAPNGTRMVEYGAANTNGLRTLEWDIGGTLGITVYTYYKQVSLADSLGGQILVNSVSGGFEIPARGSVGGGYIAGRHGVRMFAVPTAIRSFAESATLGYHFLTTVFSVPKNDAGNTINQWKDGTQLTPTWNFWNQTGVSHYHVGNNEGPNGVFRGSLGALVIFSREHDAEIRAGVEEFLRAFFED
jgi:hypothetical protein